MQSQSEFHRRLRSNKSHFRSSRVHNSKHKRNFSRICFEIEIATDSRTYHIFKSVALQGDSGSFFRMSFIVMRKQPLHSSTFDAGRNVNLAFVKYQIQLQHVSRVDKSRRSFLSTRFHYEFNYRLSFFRFVLLTDLTTHKGISII